MLILGGGEGRECEHNSKQYTGTNVHFYILFSIENILYFVIKISICLFVIKIFVFNVKLKTGTWQTEGKVTEYISMPELHMQMPDLNRLRVLKMICQLILKLSKFKFSDLKEMAIKKTES